MKSKRNEHRSARRGLTLTELVIVLFILAAIAGITLGSMSTIRDDSDRITTEASLIAVRDALIQQHLDTKYIALTGSPNTVAVESNRFHLRWLFFNPVTDDRSIDFDPDSKLGWNGPYLDSDTGKYEIDATKNLTSSYGNDNDPAILDSYTRTPIVCQVVGTASPFDVRIVSAGPDGILDIDPTDATEDLDSEGGSEPTGDDIYVSFTLR